MKFEELLSIVGEEAVFETGLLLAGEADAADVHRQLSRWTQSGRLHQLRRGLYALAPPWRKVAPHPFLVANRLAPGSYVTSWSALAHYGFIPEHVALVTSAGPGRPATWQTSLGRFELRHLHRDLLWGYRRLELQGRQRAFVATAEKALLDLVHLTPGADDRAYLEELRLQNLERLALGELQRQAERAGRPKLHRAAANLVEMARAEALEYETLTPPEEQRQR